jgi:hypothetical protein
MERLDVPTDEASDLVRFGVSPHRHCRGERRLKLRGIFQRFFGMRCGSSARKHARRLRSIRIV